MSAQGEPTSGGVVDERERSGYSTIRADRCRCVIRLRQCETRRLAGRHRTMTAKHVSVMPVIAVIVHETLCVCVSSAPLFAAGRPTPLVSCRRSPSARESRMHITPRTWYACWCLVALFTDARLVKYGKTKRRRDDLKLSSTSTDGGCPASAKSWAAAVDAAAGGGRNGSATPRTPPPLTTLWAAAAAAASRDDVSPAANGGELCCDDDRDDSPPLLARVNTSIDWTRPSVENLLEML